MSVFRRSLARRRTLPAALALALILAAALAAPGPASSAAPQRTPGPSILRFDQHAPRSDSILQAPFLPSALSRSAKLAPQLDELFRIDRLARAAGGRISAANTTGLPAELRASVDATTLRIGSAGDVQVYVESDVVASQLVPALTSLGMSVERVNDELRIVQGRLPIDALESASSLPGVVQVRTPGYAVHDAGSATTQGDAILGAASFRTIYGVDGTGVRVGVISGGLLGLAAAQTSSDLPSVDSTTCDEGPGLPTDPGTSAEGTAMLEIIHDVAPGAALYYGWETTDLEFIAAEQCLAANTDVVVTDVSFFNAGLYDGTSNVSQSLNNELNKLTNRIRSQIQSGGNYARQHYQEAFVNSGININGTAPDFWGVQRFTGTANTTDAGFGLGCASAADPHCGDEVQLAANGTLTVVLQWNDTWSNAVDDYDLLVLDETAGTITLASANVQDGSAGAHPAEAFSLTNTHGAVANYDVIIGNYRNFAAAKTFDMFTICSLCALYPNNATHNFNTASSSVPSNGDAGGGVISVGAIDASDPGNNDIEPFSSIGPTNDLRKKPDLAAIDGVAVSGAGGFPNPFFGTSAAAPHVAAIAALLLSCSPALLAGEIGDSPAADRTKLHDALINGATDLGVAGFDNTFGAGRVNTIASDALSGCDTDRDGCRDVKEPLQVPPIDPNNGWDFYSVPVPPLFVSPDPVADVRDATVSASDAQAVFAYFKKSAKTGTTEYEEDLNLNGIKDGVEYDRTVLGAGHSGPPDGIISASEAQLAFAQFKLIYNCKG